MKQIISTQLAPEAVGPYSQAVAANGTLYVSGQLPINPVTGKIEEISIEGQTNQVLQNLKAVVTTAGYTLKDVVKTTVYLADISHFGAMNNVYKQYFTSEFPARAAYAVQDLPLGAMIEIECVAVKS